ncbi:hypothetical protein L3Q82_024664 [Scortum barcoo]|uniref:Uncharacterized protein n=1 Tax=Scortum barcoo TaxID=214431 RepID=A0ACB8WQ21_9TELE|nr:hypothetical protein L3Q82_024664 [Scortum barcoo]
MPSVPTRDILPGTCAAGVSTDPGSNSKELAWLSGPGLLLLVVCQGLCPLHWLTQKGQVFQWSEDCTQAFAQLRSALTEALVLAYPDPCRPFIVDTEYSNMGLGAMLSQEGEQGEQVIAYFSHSLANDGANDTMASPPGELAALEPEGQLARWTLQDYNFEVRHRAGRLHVNTDALFRQPCKGEDCKYCQRMEEQDTAAPKVAALWETPVVDDGRPPDSSSGGPQDHLWTTTTVLRAFKSPEQLRHDQSQDPVFFHVQDWEDWPRTRMASSLSIGH